MKLPAATRRGAFLVLLPEAIAACLRFRWRLYRDAAATLRAPAPAIANPKHPSLWPPRDISRAVYLASSLLPGTLCLPQSMAVREMLSRRGHDCRLQLGVSKTGGFHAHAWVTDTAGEVVHGKLEEPFQPLVPRSAAR